MATNGTLSNRQALAVGALVAGATFKEAAKKANVAKRTISRWAKADYFIAAVKTGREEALARTLHAIELGVGEGVEVLRMLAKVTPKRLAQLGATARVRGDASKALVALLPKASGADAEDARLAELERILGVKVVAK